MDPLRTELSALLPLPTITPWPDRVAGHGEPASVALAGIESAAAILSGDDLAELSALLEALPPAPRSAGSVHEYRVQQVLAEAAPLIERNPKLAEAVLQVARSSATSELKTVLLEQVASDQSRPEMMRPAQLLPGSIHLAAPVNLAPPILTDAAVSRSGPRRLLLRMGALRVAARFLAERPLLAFVLAWFCSGLAGGILLLVTQAVVGIPSGTMWQPNGIWGLGFLAWVVVGFWTSLRRRH